LSGGGYFGAVKQQDRADDPAPIEAAVELLRGSVDDVMRGITLIDAAADQGDGEALQRKAVFEAMGCARPQDWKRALDCLAGAAQAGSESAQRQLEILARGAATSAGQQPDWAAIASQVSSETLAEAPAKIPLSESPRLRVTEGFASRAECGWIIDRARDRLRRATVVDRSGSMTVEAARTNSGVEFLLADMDLVIEAIRLRISAATRLPLPLFEPAQVLHYAPGQEFQPHHDFFDPELPGHAEQIRQYGQRIGTFLLYLNQGYEGGETAFPRAQISYRGNTGDALFMANVDRSGRPDPSSLHWGTSPTSGEKWILSQWIRDKAPTGPTVGSKLKQPSRP